MADMTPQGTQEYSVETGYESADANVKAVVSGVGIIFGSTLVVMAAMFGMFNYLNRQAEETAAKVPVALAKTIVPPEPRLLPSPYTDTINEAAALKADSPDRLPWDKRDTEIVKQYDESNSVYKKGGSISIPIDRAIELEADPNFKGEVKAPPAVMAWQSASPGLIAGKTNGSMNLKTGEKNTEPTTYDRRAHWETEDEKFSAESSGGVVLKKGQISR